MYTPVTREAVMSCTDFLHLGCTVGRAVVELNLAGIGHYTPVLYTLGLGTQLYGRDTLVGRMGSSSGHCIVYEFEPKFRDLCELEPLASGGTLEFL